MKKQQVPMVARSCCFYYVDMINDSITKDGTFSVPIPQKSTFSLNSGSFAKCQIA